MELTLKKEQKKNFWGAILASPWCALSISHRGMHFSGSPHQSSMISVLSICLRESVSEELFERKLHI